MCTPECDMKYLKKSEGLIGRKGCEYNHKDEVDSPNILRHNNYQNFRQNPPRNMNVPGHKERPELWFLYLMEPPLCVILCQSNLFRIITVVLLIRCPVRWG